jgi:hypothetical protein
LPRGKIKSTFSTIPWDNGGVGFSPDSQTLALGFTAWEYDDWLGKISGGMFPGSRRRNLPASSGTKLLDVETGRVFATFEGWTYGEFSPDGTMWAMHGTDGAINIWDVPAPKGNWPIVLWGLFGFLGGISLCSWLWRRYHRSAQARSDSDSARPDRVTSL